MDGVLSEEWVKGMDNKFVSEARKVASMISNCPVDSQIENLQSIKLFFLQLKSTSQTQPMDQNVARKSVEKKKYLPKIYLLLGI